MAIAAEDARSTKGFVQLMVVIIAPQQAMFDEGSRNFAMWTGSDLKFSEQIIEFLLGRTNAATHDRIVKTVDGTMLTLPDTVENQKEYPQPKSQKPGAGFPIMRVVVNFSTGGVFAELHRGFGCAQAGDRRRTLTDCRSRCARAGCVQ